MPHHDTIHVCYSVHDKHGTYCKFLGTAIRSLICNTDAPVTVHLLHDRTLSPENREKLSALVRSHGKDLLLYNVDAAMGEELRHMERRLPSILQSRLSPAAIYRLLLGNLLDSEISRAIYLDADTVVNLDIRELWQESTGPAGIAAVCEKHLAHGYHVHKHLCKIGKVSDERYFNSGVLLMDLEALRSRPELLEEGIGILCRYPECDSLDQDILNWFFADSYQKLPLRYNVFPEAERIVGNQSLDACIYHYAGIAADCLQSEDVYNRLFFHHFVRTPWFNEDVFLKAVSDCARLVAGVSRTEARWFFNAVAGRKRILYGNAESEADLREMFALGADEIYFPISDIHDVSLIVEHMKNCPNMLHVFCSIEDFSALARYLESHGFRPNRDFINGDLLIAEENGGEPVSQHHAIRQNVFLLL